MKDYDVAAGVQVGIYCFSESCALTVYTERWAAEEKRKKTSTTRVRKCRAILEAVKERESYDRIADAGVTRLPPGLKKFD